MTSCQREDKSTLKGDPGEDPNFKLGRDSSQRMPLSGWFEFPRHVDSWTFSVSASGRIVQAGPGCHQRPCAMSLVSSCIYIRHCQLSGSRRCSLLDDFGGVVMPASVRGNITGHSGSVDQHNQVRCLKLKQLWQQQRCYTRVRGGGLFVASVAALVAVFCFFGVFLKCTLFTGLARWRQSDICCVSLYSTSWWSYPPCLLTCSYGIALIRQRCWCSSPMQWFSVFTFVPAS